MQCYIIGPISSIFEIIVVYSHVYKKSIAFQIQIQLNDNYK